MTYMKFDSLRVLKKYPRELNITIWSFRVMALSLLVLVFGGFFGIKHPVVLFCLLSSTFIFISNVALVYGLTWLKMEKSIDPNEFDTYDTGTHALIHEILFYGLQASLFVLAFEIAFSSL